MKNNTSALLSSPPSWICQMDVLPGPMTGALSSDLCSGADLADRVYGTAAQALHSGLVAFAYCWRRFGPPWWGSDAHKDLGHYIVGTSHLDVCLSLSLSGSALRYGVGYLITTMMQDLYEIPMTVWEQQFESWWLAHQVSQDEYQLLQRYDEQQSEDISAVEKARLRALQRRLRDDRSTTSVVRAAEGLIGRYPRISPAEGSPVIRQAITDALTELLRPVYVRDVAMNILGRVADTDLQEETDVAERSAYAGFGVPKAAMDAWMKQEL